MDVWILMSWKTSLKQRAWTIENCPYCQGLEPTRVEERVWTFSVYFIPLIRENRGWIGRCDFCERPIKPDAPPTSVPLDDWSPKLGLAPLLRRLGYTGKVVVRNAPLDERWKSLLKAAHDATGLNSMDTTFGMTSGAVYGIVLGALIGYVLWQFGLFPASKDSFRFVFLGAIAGLVLGVISGAALQWLLGRVPLAARIIGTACANYKVDLNRLAELSQNYSWTVQQAVREVRDEQSLGNA